MKIVLISANRCTTPYPVYPLGLSHVAAALELAGHDVTLLDVNVHDTVIGEILTRVNPGLVGISLRNVDDVNIDVRHCFAPDLLEMTALARRCCTAPVVLGGSAYSLFPQELLTLSGADWGVRGEGENAIVALAAVLGAGGVAYGIPGLVYVRNGRVVSNDKATVPPSSVPIPVRPPELASFYLGASTMLNVQTQRGCPYTCCYCTYPLIEGSALRRRSPADVVADLENGRSRGGRYFFVVDSVFNTSHEHVAGICEGIIRAKLDIRWGCFLRPQNIDTQLMGLMARAGLKHIEFGSDSFSDTVLGAYGKGLVFEDILAASRAARAHGVRHAHFLIVGGPGETEATLRESFENATVLPRTVIFPFIGMRVYPGTPLHSIAVADGSVSAELNLFDPAFYLSRLISRERIVAILDEFNRESKRWIFGEEDPEMARVQRMLRAQGVEGPLWEFLIR